MAVAWAAQSARPGQVSPERAASGPSVMGWRDAGSGG